MGNGGLSRRALPVSTDSSWPRTLLYRVDTPSVLSQEPGSWSRHAEHVCLWSWLRGAGSLLTTGPAMHTGMPSLCSGQVQIEREAGTAQQCRLDFAHFLRL